MSTRRGFIAGLLGLLGLGKVAPATEPKSRRVALCLEPGGKVWYVPVYWVGGGRPALAYFIPRACKRAEAP